MTTWGHSYFNTSSGSGEEQIDPHRQTHRINTMSIFIGIIHGDIFGNSL